MIPQNIYYSSPFIVALDLLLTPLYLIMCYVFIILPFSESQCRDAEERRELLTAWLVKIVSGIAIYYLLYKLYYGSGDIVEFFEGSRILAASFYLKPLDTLGYIIHSISSLDYTSYFQINADFASLWRQNNLTLYYPHDPGSITTYISIFPLFVMSINTITPAIVLFNSITMPTYFYLYLSIKNRYRISSKALYYLIFYLPSYLSWTSLPFKEGICLPMLVYIVNSIHFMRFSRIRYAKSALFIYLLFAIKPYILLSFSIVLTFSILALVRDRIRNKMLVYLTYSGNILLLPFIFYGFITYLSSKSGKYQLENIPKQIELVYTDLKYNPAYYGATGGSVYDLGELEPTIQGIASKFPLGLFIALFRPFLWEAKKPILLLASIETSFLLIYLLLSLSRYGIINSVKEIFSDEIRASFVIYGIVFLGLVGIASGNFGNLMRYKVPGLFFFCLALGITFARLRAQTAHNWGRQ
ncbi:MAG: hypothetical protein NZ958_05130 [Bacteroidia bacterium]|nr:hypothetical protein [Bacteroidia bacterium]MDW8089034.1 hypothetical protein [Bacteroidia bacterium]